MQHLATGPHLAEAVRLPAALSPKAGVAWESGDAWSGRVTLAEGARSATATFRFAERGEIERADALRYRDVRGTPVLTPMASRAGDHARASAACRRLATAR